MENSQSKRESSYSSETIQTLSEAEIEQLRKSLPPDKKLKERRLYQFRTKIKRKAAYLNYYIDYIEDEKLRAEWAEEEEMDALSWWSSNGHRYPILSRMTRDILAIPLFTVASESAFSAGGRHLDPFQSSLTPKMVQALICTQDWLRAKGVSIVDVEENLKDLEKIEKDVQCDDMDDEVIFVDSLV